METIIIPNVPFNPTGKDILEFTAETLLRRKKLSNALNRVNVKGRLNYNLDLIRQVTISLTSISLLSEDNPITFEFKNCYSLYGVVFNENLNDYSIGIRISEKLYYQLKNIKQKASTFVNELIFKSLMKTGVDELKIIHLPLKEDQAISLIKINELPFKVNGKFTITGIYTRWFNTPNLEVYTDEIKYKS